MIRALARSWQGRALLAVYATTAVVLAFVPFTDHISFEFAAALTIVAALAAPWVGFAAVNHERRSGGVRPARAAAHAGAFATAALLLPVAIILLNGLRRPLCEPVAASIWLVLEPAPTAWLGATLGALARLLFRRTWVAVVAVLAVIVGSGVTTFLSYYFGPAGFGLDWFIGSVPGTERGAITVTPPIVSFRAATAAWGAAMVSMIGAIGTADFSAKRMHRSWAVALSLALIVISVGWGDDLGWRTTDASLRRVLGAEQRFGNVIVHYPRDYSDRQIDLISRDAEFIGREVERVLEIEPSHPVHVWLHRNAASKARLVGNGATAFAKPFRHEVHVLDFGSLRHELIHGFGAEFGRGPWGVAGGLIPNIALIEGLAMAYDVDDEPLTLFQDAKAQRVLKIAPDLRKMMSWSGFGGFSTTRAYNYSGAFVRYLATTYGTPKVRELYRTNDFSSLGNVDSVIAGFERMLDTVQSDANARSYAARRHSEPTMSKRQCPREIIAITDSALALATNRRWDASLALLDRACAMQPDNPDLRTRKLYVAIRMRAPDMGLIRSTADSVLAHPNTDPALMAQTHVSLGNEYWRRGDTSAARREFTAAAAIPSGPDTRRGVASRLMALADPERARLVRGYFLDLDTFAEQVRLMDAIQKRPTDPLLLYLGSRMYGLRGAYQKSVELGLRAESASLGDRDMWNENRRMMIESLTYLNQCDAAETSLAGYISAGASMADVETSKNLIRRCRFAVANGWPPR